MLTEVVLRNDCFIGPCGFSILPPSALCEFRWLIRLPAHRPRVPSQALLQQPSQHTVAVRDEPLPRLPCCPSSPSFARRSRPGWRPPSCGPTGSTTPLSFGQCLCVTGFATEELGLCVLRVSQHGHGVLVSAKRGWGHDYCPQHHDSSIIFHFRECSTDVCEGFKGKTCGCSAEEASPPSASIKAASVSTTSIANRRGFGVFRFSYVLVSL